MKPNVECFWCGHQWYSKRVDGTGVSSAVLNCPVCGAKGPHKRVVK